MITKSDVLQAAANYLYCNVDQLECELKVFAACSTDMSESLLLEPTRGFIDEYGGNIEAGEREIFFIVNEFCVNCQGSYSINLLPYHQQFINIDFSRGGVFCKVLGIAPPNDANQATLKGANGQIIYYHIKRK